jgi:hypothetical protein
MVTTYPERCALWRIPEMEGILNQWILMGSSGTDENSRYRLHIYFGLFLASNWDNPLVGQPQLLGTIINGHFRNRLIGGTYHI